MNSLNQWCRIAAPVLCLVLGLEAYAFGHGLATQAHALQPQVALSQKTTPSPLKLAAN
jgi:hypothetical protein